MDELKINHFEYSLSCNNQILIIIEILLT